MRNYFDRDGYSNFNRFRNNIVQFYINTFDLILYFPRGYNDIFRLKPEAEKHVGMSALRYTDTFFILHFLLYFFFSLILARSTDRFA